MSEVHIFDFDGTLFYSPAPTHSAADSLIPPTSSDDATDATETAAHTLTAEERRAEEVNKLYGSLLNPVDSGGYGWFQSIHTMTPPFIPEKPDPNVWFVAPILAHMRALVERRNAQLRNPHAKAEDMPLLYVLTGRDAKYYDRIWTLLQQVGLDNEVEDVILKPHETAGTVTYKLNKFFKIIQEHRPSRVFYYEDRVNQGGRLLEGIRMLEEVLYHHLHGGGRDTTTVADRVGVVTFDVETSERNNIDALTHGDALHTPQPEVKFQFGKRAAQNRPLSPAEADPRHSFLTATLRASPYPLLRDACYPLDRIAVFYQDEEVPTTGADTTDEKTKKATERAVRQAQRWVASTVEFWNSKSATCRGRGGRGRGAGVLPVKVPMKEFDACALHDTIRFNFAPPFAFIMVLIPAAICDRSNYMLDTVQFAALVERLKAERNERVGQGAAAQHLKNGAVFPPNGFSCQRSD